MSEAVIVATARSPIGRAAKGSLVDLRPDDMSAQIVRALMAKVPQVAPDDVEDLIMGCGQPAGEAGFNIGRAVAILSGLDGAPGVTVNRYCSSSLQTIRMAAHAIKSGEGDCFIAAGVEAVSRYGSGASDTAPNPVFKQAARYRRTLSALRCRARASARRPCSVRPRRNTGEKSNTGRDSALIHELFRIVPPLLALCGPVREPAQGNFYRNQGGQFLTGNGAENSKASRTYASYAKAIATD